MFFALAVFLVVLTLFAMDFIHRTPAVMVSGVLLVTTGIVTEQEAIEVVYWETLGLLMGMILVGTLRARASSAT
jgi:Na+/H+ antiporter NhaD/arsenite permease-like protein